MKIKGYILPLLSVVCILFLFFGSVAFGQEARKIKMDEYKAQLAGFQTRETAATTKLDTLQAEIDQSKAQIAETQNQIDATWNEIYTMVGTDKAGVDSSRENLENIGGQIDGLAALSPEDLFRRQSEIEGIEKSIEEAKGSKVALLTEMENKLAELDGNLAALKAKVPANIYDHYTVLKGDYLWKIAKKDDIYGNPYQWIRIYCVNKDQIKDPDLIYSDQVFNIARGVGKNEHLVVKGEWLSKIAGCAKVFNDPTKWTKLYEANKDVVKDPSLIYPYQVLTIPKE